jgi:hypothetical protein
MGQKQMQGNRTATDAKVDQKGTPPVIARPRLEPTMMQITRSIADIWAKARRSLKRSITRP